MKYVLQLKFSERAEKSAKKKYNAWTLFLFSVDRLLIGASRTSTEILTDWFSHFKKSFNMNQNFQIFVITKFKVNLKELIY